MFETALAISPVSDAMDAPKPLTFKGRTFDVQSLTFASLKKLERMTAAAQASDDATAFDETSIMVSVALSQCNGPVSVEDVDDLLDLSPECPKFINDVLIRARLRTEPDAKNDEAPEAKTPKAKK